MDDTGDDVDAEDEEDLVGTLEVEDLEDLEESLDLLLALRLAAAPGEDRPEEDRSEEDGSGARSLPGLGLDGARLACGPEEFVCRGCFLVHHRSQLAEGGALVCRDCAGCAPGRPPASGAPGRGPAPGDEKGPPPAGAAGRGELTFLPAGDGQRARPRWAA
ncbi:MAG: DUF4193 family protein, partial [Acidobacteriota bacterium]|nr:DUF4193 family protein [Acidobacteriota bacterium]